MAILPVPLPSTTVSSASIKGAGSHSIRPFGFTARQGRLWVRSAPGERASAIPSSSRSTSIITSVPPSSWRSQFPLVDEEPVPVGGKRQSGGQPEGLQIGRRQLISLAAAEAGPGQREYHLRHLAGELHTFSIPYAVSARQYGAVVCCQAMVCPYCGSQTADASPTCGACSEWVDLDNKPPWADDIQALWQVVFDYARSQKASGGGTGDADMAGLGQAVYAKMSELMAGGKGPPWLGK